MREVVQYRQFTLRIFAYTPHTKSFLQDVLAHLPPGFSVPRQPPAETLWRLHLVSADPVMPVAFDRDDRPDDFMVKLHKDWSKLGAGWKGDSLFSLNSNRNSPTSEYVHFISDHRRLEEERAAIGIHLYQILRRWLMACGNILLHSSGITHRGHGFLFLGRSGAGKTTVTTFRPESAGLLHDDTVFLYKKNGSYLLFRNPDLNGSADESIGENAMTHGQTGDIIGETRLSGIFILKQDQTDFLVPVSNLQAAHELVQSYLDLPRIYTYEPSYQELHNAVRTLSKVAREIPAYELHFRKSREFWKLIDEKFPD